MGARARRRSNHPRGCGVELLRTTPLAGSLCATKPCSVGFQDIDAQVATPDWKTARAQKALLSYVRWSAERRWKCWKGLGSKSPLAFCESKEKLSRMLPWVGQAFAVRMAKPFWS